MKPAPPTLSNHPPSPPRSMPMPRVDSAVLLGRYQEIEILHAGETYRLRQTRQGKLILTK